MKGIKHGGRAMSMPAGLAVGAAVSVGITLILSAAAAKMMVLDLISENGIGYAALCILFVSAFMGAIASTRKIKRCCLMVCMLSGVMYMAVLMSATALLFGGKYEAVGVTGLLIFGGCAVAALFETGRKREGGRKKRRRVSC